MANIKRYYIPFWWDYYSELISSGSEKTFKEQPNIKGSLRRKKTQRLKVRLWKKVIRLKVLKEEKKIRLEIFTKGSVGFFIVAKIKGLKINMEEEIMKIEVINGRNIIRSEGRVLTYGEFIKWIEKQTREQRIIVEKIIMALQKLGRQEGIKGVKTPLGTIFIGEEGQIIITQRA